MQRNEKHSMVGYIETLRKNVKFNQRYFKSQLWVLFKNSLSVNLDERTIRDIVSNYSKIYPVASFSSGVGYIFLNTENLPKELKERAVEVAKHSVLERNHRAEEILKACGPLEEFIKENE